MPEPRVLVVDDDAACREVMREWLSGYGYAVTGAGTGAAALAQFGGVPPDLLITDWWMPDLSGGELLAAIRALGYTVPVIIATALVTRGDRLAGQALVSKMPADGSSFLEALLAAVRGCIGPGRG